MPQISPTISVIIPTYNGASYLDEAINSILNQTFADFELIIIDDVSSDFTVKISEEFAKQDARIRLYQNDKNLGFAANRNKAVSLVRGRYIAWQDQDDISLPDRLARQLSVMEEDYRVGIVGGAMEIFSEKGSIGVRYYPIGDDEIRRMIFRFSPIALPACMIRKTALEKVGEYSERWSPAGDLDMTFKLGMSYRLANIPGIAIRYRVHKNSSTYRNLKRIEKDSIRIRFNYARCPGYRMTSFDRLYNFLHYISIWVVPAPAKMWLFDKIRSSRE